MELARRVSAIAGCIRSGRRSDGGARGAASDCGQTRGGRRGVLWRAVLGYVPMADDNAVDPLGHASTVWMQELDDVKPLRHAMHVDVSVARECAHERLAAALAAGGRIVGRLACALPLDARRPRWQPCLHLRMARRERALTVPPPTVACPGLSSRSGPRAPALRSRRQLGQCRRVSKVECGHRRSLSWRGSSTTMPGGPSWMSARPRSRPRNARPS